MKFVNLGLVAALGLAASACATGTTKVEAPVASKQMFSSITVVKDENTIEVPQNIQDHFANRLNQYLLDEKMFAAGQELTLRYRFVQFDPGNRALRYVVGFGAGKGTMTIDVGFFDAQGNKIADIDVGGELSVGFLGGDIDEAVSKAAKQVSNFAEANFTNRPTKGKKK